jgi:hypothetical protein
MALTTSLIFFPWPYADIRLQSNDAIEPSQITSRPYGVAAQHAVLLLDVRAGMVLTSVAMVTVEGDEGMSRVTRMEGWHASIT